MEFKFDQINVSNIIKSLNHLYRSGNKFNLPFIVIAIIKIIIAEPNTNYKQTNVYLPYGR